MDGRTSPCMTAAGASKLAASYCLRNVSEDRGAERGVERGFVSLSSSVIVPRDDGLLRILRRGAVAGCSRC